MTNPGDVVRIPGYNRCWVIIELTDDDFNVEPEKIPNAEGPGIYAFGGMWYGNDAANHKSFGKIHYLKGDEEYVGNVTDYGISELKELCD